MESERVLLGVVDYVIFVLMLLISAGIGVYFRFSGGKQKTNEEFLLAGKDMAVLPVAFSLMASFLSAITVMGVPAEMYLFGVHLAYMNIGYVVGIVFSSYVSLPVFFELQASTAYEYLDRRFGNFARTLASITFVVQMILYMSTVLYAPALALNAVSNLSIWISVVSIGVVCTFYCTLGGMKAVLWTDVFQALLMYIGIFVVLIKGITTFGITGIYTIAKDGGRLDFAGFSLDPTKRYTFWNIIFQGLLFSMISYGGNQVQVQRLLTVKNISRSRKAMYVSIPMAVSFHLLTCFAGIVIYAYYANCDPMTSPAKPISSADQLLPYYIMDTLGKFPGLPGLCICGIFSASLSTVSSAVNSLTAVTMQDLVRPFLVSRGLSESKMAFYSKAITLFYGFLCIALTFIVASLGNIIQATLTIFGMLGAPLLSVFLLGMLSTRANETGAVIGLVSSVALSAWLSFGSNSKKVFLPVSVENCPSFNSSLEEMTTLYFLNATYPTSTEFQNLTFANDFTKSSIEPDVFSLYKISYMWFAPIGLSLGLIIGYISSVIVNVIKGNVKDVPEEFLSPVFKYFFKKTPEKEIKNGNIKTLPSEFPIELQIVNEKSNGIPDIRIVTENVRL